MDKRFYGVEAVGLDLDQTLYPDSPEVKKAVRTEFYRHIARVLGCPYEQAERLFEAHFEGLGSTSRTFQKLGIPNAGEAVRDCLATADVAAILKPDERLKGMLAKLKEAYPTTFLMTDDREGNTKKKLDALGIGTEPFRYLFCWNPEAGRKDDGRLFEYAQRTIGVEPGKIVFVGNSEGDDVMHPKKLGWRTVHLSNKPSPHATAGISEIYDLEGLLL